MLLLNNQHLGMVVQWEDRFYKGNRGHTYLGAGHEEEEYPNFVQIAKGFKVGAKKIIDKKDLDEALEQMIRKRWPLCATTCMFAYQEHVLPMIPSGKTVRDIIKA